MSEERAAYERLEVGHLHPSKRMNAGGQCRWCETIRAKMSANKDVLENYEKYRAALQALEQERAEVARLRDVAIAALDFLKIAHPDATAGLLWTMYRDNLARALDLAIKHEAEWPAEPSLDSLVVE